MIKSFRDKHTESVFRDKHARGVPENIQQRARRKLRMLDAATVIEDLSTPLSNRLEKLHGNRRGQYSIRINDQWRLCFVWEVCDALDVEIVDYH
ncbi:MAG: type II toxin-antitoxin system RelE/ParE family toxin [Pseudomonadales bacterium]